VLYVTCSPHLAETEAVVADIHRLGGSVVAMGEHPGLDLPAGSIAGPHVRLWPAEHDTDGMFAALVRRD
jgi:16S rRNA (cytosine967-C5)-methyltransferase